MNRKFTKFCLIIVSFLHIFLNGCKERENTITRVPTFKGKKLEAVTVRQKIPFTGTLRMGDEHILSFKIAGYVQEIPVKESDQVKKGALIAKLNLTEIQAVVQSLEAALDNARWHYEKMKTLYEEGVISQSTFKNAEMEYKIAQSKLEQARFNMQRAEIRAPCDGMILKKLAREGELVAAGQPIILFTSLEMKPEIITSISARYISLIQVGDSASFFLSDYLSIKLSGKVFEIGGLSEPGVGTFEVKIRCTQPDTFPILKSGLIGKGEIISTNHFSSFFIPFDAIYDSDEGEIVVYGVSSDSILRKFSLPPLFWTDSGVYCQPVTNEEYWLILEDASSYPPGIKVKLK